MCFFLALLYLKNGWRERWRTTLLCVVVLILPLGLCGSRRNLGVCFLFFRSIFSLFSSFVEMFNYCFFKTFCVGVVPLYFIFDDIFFLGSGWIRSNKLTRFEIILISWCIEPKKKQSYLSVLRVF